MHRVGLAAPARQPRQQHVAPRTHGDGGGAAVVVQQALGTVPLAQRQPQHGEVILGVAAPHRTQRRQALGRRLQPLQRQVVVAHLRGQDADVHAVHQRMRPAVHAELVVQRADVARQRQAVAHVAAGGLGDGQVRQAAGHLGQVTGLARQRDGFAQRGLAGGDAPGLVQRVGQRRAVFVALAQRAGAVVQRRGLAQPVDGLGRMAQLRARQAPLAQRVQRQRRLAQALGQRQRRRHHGIAVGEAACHQVHEPQRLGAGDALALVAGFVGQALRQRHRGAHAFDEQAGLDPLRLAAPARSAVARGLPGGSGAAPQGQRVDQPAGATRTLGGLLERRGGLDRVARGFPVFGTARRLAAAALQPARHRGMHVARDGLGHAAQRGVGDQVVREGFARQHLRRLQLGPGVDQRQRRLLQHGFGQLDAEVDTSDRRHPRQRQRRRRQGLQPPLDQRADAGRLRQPAVGHAGQHVVLQRLQREQRVAAGVAHQRAGQCGSVEPGHAQAVDQLAHRRLVQRLQRLLVQALRFEQRLVQRGAAFAGAARQAPAQRQRRLGRHHGLQQLQAGGVGEVQVVEQQLVAAGGRGPAQQGLGGALQLQALAVAAECRAVAGIQQLGQHTRQAAARGLVGRGAAALQQQPQQPRQQRKRHAGVARPRRHVQAARAAPARQLGEQPRLAHAGLADEDEHALGRPGALQRGELVVAAHQARRPAQAGRHAARARHRTRRHRALDRGQQRQRLGAGRRAQFVLQPLFQALERGQRRGAVAAQVVQPHQPAAGVFRQRLQLQHRLHLGQRRHQCTGGLVLRRGGGVTVQALRPAAFALLLQPVRHLGTVAVVAAGQQLAVRVVEVGHHAGQQHDPLAGLHQRVAERAPQPEDALPQVARGGLLRGLGPQPGGQAGARHRAFGLQQRQPAGVLAFQRPAGVAAAAGGGRAGQAQPDAVGRRRQRGIGLGSGLGGGSRHRRLGQRLPPAACRGGSYQWVIGWIVRGTCATRPPSLPRHRGAAVRGHGPWQAPASLG